MNDNALGAALIVLLGIPLVILLSGVIALLVAWPVMLLIGNAAIASGGVVPALGYWTTFWLTWAIMIVTAHPTNKVKE